MSDERMSRAIERIERACDRIETAVGRPVGPAGDGALTARHDLLRSRVEAAIDGIDRLLAASPR